MKKLIEDLTKKVNQRLEEVNSVRELEDLRVSILGKSGELTEILKNMKNLSVEEKPIIGAIVNKAKSEIESKLNEKKSYLELIALEAKLEKDKIDVTLPSKRVKKGSIHPVSYLENTMIEFFKNLGFDVYDGPEIEYHEYNFDKLNIPIDHPARDAQDTLYIDDEFLLRSQTSTMQIRVMEKQKPPIKMVSFGRVYRDDDPDATHTPVFNQFEGLVVDKNVTLGDLQGMLNAMLVYLYGEGIKTRFRPSFFPFTEPSVEVDATCTKCGGKGCTACKWTGWVELLGAGLVNPNVLENCGIDSKVYSAFAFGFGVERILSPIFNINSLKLLYDNDMRAIKQWK